MNLSHAFSQIVICCAGALFAGDDYQFRKPLMLMADGKPIRTESPGYASPCWGDVDGDGQMELLVGQFAGGKIGIYEHNGDLTFTNKGFLQAEGSVAEIPGVW